MPGCHSCRSLHWLHLFGYVKCTINQVRSNIFFFCSVINKANHFCRSKENFFCWWHVTNLIFFICFPSILLFLLPAHPPYHAAPWHRLFVFVCLMPNICFRDQNLQSHFTYGCTGFRWSATHFDSMQHCMPDALGIVGFMHNLRWGKFVCIDMLPLFTVNAQYCSHSPETKFQNQFTWTMLFRHWNKLPLPIPARLLSTTPPIAVDFSEDEISQNVFHSLDFLEWLSCVVSLDFYACITNDVAMM